eukprot:7107371-Prymnesium_polylepis.1
MRPLLAAAIFCLWCVGVEGLAVPQGRPAGRGRGGAATRGRGGAGRGPSAARGRGSSNPYNSRAYQPFDEFELRSRDRRTRRPAT